MLDILVMVLIPILIGNGTANRMSRPGAMITTILSVLGMVIAITVVDAMRKGSEWFMVPLPLYLIPLIIPAAVGAITVVIVSRRTAP